MGESGRALTPWSRARDPAAFLPVPPGSAVVRSLPFRHDLHGLRRTGRSQPPVCATSGRRPRSASNPVSQEQPLARSQLGDAANGSVFERVIAALPLSTVFRELLGEDAVHPASEPGSYKVVCPFHEDRNPSLHLSDTKKVWHCFGCQASGNLFSLEKRVKGLESVPEALTSLAKRYPQVAELVAGRPLHFRPASTSASLVADFPPLPPISRRPGPPRLSRLWGHELSTRRQTERVLEAARVFFLQHFEESPRAREYLRKRGVSDDTVRTYEFGYAPDSYDTMSLCTNALRSQGFSDEDCIHAGVAKKDKAGRVYDVFRDRIIVPIRDIDGHVISFAGRLLEESISAPKYVNGVNSSLFQKKRTLFGADVVARFDDCSAVLEYGKVLLVEGYMDVISVHQRSGGKISCVASMGTAVSVEQIKSGLDLLGDRADGKLIINLDGDEAGLAAAERVCESVLPAMTDVGCVHIASPPEPAKDVGEYFDMNLGTIEDYVNHLDSTALHWIEWRAMRIIKQVLDERARVQSEVQVVQAAELGALGDDDDETWSERGLQSNRLSETVLMAEEVRLQSRKLLDSLSGEGDANSLSKNDTADALDADEEHESLWRRGQRRAQSLARPHRSIAHDSADGETIAGCPKAILEQLGSFLSKALRGSPGVNLPWLVHCWADTLSGGVSKRIPVLYDAIMFHIDKGSRIWTPNSPASMIDMMPPPPWVIDELPKYRQRQMLSSIGMSEGKDMGLSDYYGDKLRQKQSDARLEAQALYLEPRLEEVKSSARLRLSSKPRACAEEIVLRALLWADENDRLDALDALIAVMIEVEEADLFPFWTSEARDGLFQYLVETEGNLSVQEIAADCETKEWWTEEIEELFIPVEEFRDDVLTEIREIELLEPVLTVTQAAKSVAEMAKRVATGRAVDQLGLYVESKLGLVSGEDALDLRADSDHVRHLIDSVSGEAFRSIAERAESEKRSEEARAQYEEDKELKMLEEKLLRGEYMEYPWKDDATEAPPE